MQKLQIRGVGIAQIFAIGGRPKLTTEGTEHTEKATADFADGTEHGLAELVPPN